MNVRRFFRAAVVVAMAAMLGGSPAGAQSVPTAAPDRTPAPGGASPPPTTVPLPTGTPSPSSTPSSTPSVTPIASATPAAAALPKGPYVPAGTAVHFHLNAPISSADSKSGTPFTFTLIAPIVATGGITIPSGSYGHGTLILAGRAGHSGHEGDLTLQLVSVTMSGHRQLNFVNQRFEVNGRNQKIVAGVLGFAPYIGIGAMFIRGSDITIGVKNPVLTVLKNPAPIVLLKIPKPMVRMTAH
jgi:hypothetical protein